MATAPSPIEVPTTHEPQEPSPERIDWLYSVSAPASPRGGTRRSPRKHKLRRSGGDKEMAALPGEPDESLKRLSDMVNDLKNQLEEKADECKRLARARRLAEKQAKKAKFDNIQLREQLQSARDQVGLLEGQQAADQEAPAGLAPRVLELRKKLSTSEKARSALQRKVEELAADLRDAGRNSAGKTHADLERTIQENSQKLAEARKRVGRSELVSALKLASANKTIENLRKTTAEKSMALNSAGEKVAELKKKLHTEATARSGLKKMMDEFLKGMEGSKHDSNNYIKGVQNAMEVVEARNAELEKEVKILKKETQRADSNEQKLNAALFDVEKLAAENEELQAQIERLRHDEKNSTLALKKWQKAAGESSANIAG